MALIATQEQTLSNWLKMEDYADLKYCRDLFSFKGVANTTYPHGTVLAVKTGETVMQPWVANGADGLGTAVAVLFADVTSPASGDNIDCLAIFRGPVSVNYKGLVVPVGTTTPQKNAIKDQLEAKGFQVLWSVVSEAFPY